MAIIENFLTIDKNLPVPVYLQISNGIIGLIRRGILQPASALPSSRALAAALKVHRKTVVAAYDELDAQSWTDVYPRKGIFVARKLPDIKPRGLPGNAGGLPGNVGGRAGNLEGRAGLAGNAGATSFAAATFFEVNDEYVPYPQLYKAGGQHSIVFNDGFPDTRIAPVDLLIREYRRFSNYRFTSKYLLYGPEQGSENLRNELARFLSETRGLPVSPANILITKGAQMAMYLTAQVLLSKGDTVIVADPGYPGVNQVFEQAGARLALVPVDEQGMDLDAVESVAKKKKVRLLYVIPHHHRPTTVTLSPERRMQLLELAAKYRFAIIEDDYDYDFHYASSPILPLASADYHGSVIYVGSFGKTIAPGIRIGFAVAPPNLILQLTRLRRMIDRQGEQLLEEAMANLLKNGDISRHLKKAGKIYHERRDVLCRLLDEQLGEELSYMIPTGGFGIWAKYASGIRAGAVASAAATMGLSVSDGSDYFYRSENQKFIRLGFASLTVKELEEGVRILGKAIKKGE